VGRCPSGAARRADSLPPEKRVEAKLGGLESAAGLVTRPTQLTERLVLARGDVDGGEIARAPQAGPWHGVTPVGLDASAGLLRQQGRRDDPADGPCLAEGAVEPIAAWSRVRDQAQRRGLGWPLAEEVVKVIRGVCRRSRGR
jgi:hypothetical protein